MAWNSTLSMSDSTAASTTVGTTHDVCRGCQDCNLKRDSPIKDKQMMHQPECLATHTLRNRVRAAQQCCRSLPNCWVPWKKTRKNKMHTVVWLPVPQQREPRRPRDLHELQSACDGERLFQPSTNVVDDRASTFVVFFAALKHAIFTTTQVPLSTYTCSKHTSRTTSCSEGTATNALAAAPARVARHL